MKRFWGILLCLCMLPTAASAETFTVSYDGVDDSTGYALMLDVDGTLLTERDQYQNIFCISQGDCLSEKRLYAATPAMLAEAPAEIPGSGEASYDEYYRLAMVDALGNQLTGFDYLNLVHDAQSGVVVFTLPDRRQGVMDENGNCLLEARYAAIVPNGEGGYLALAAPEAIALDEETEYPIIYIDSQGRCFKTGYHTQISGLGSFSHGFCAVTQVSEYNGQTIYLDIEGTHCFDRSFTYGDSFYDNFAVVQEAEDSGYSLIDKNGACATSTSYDFIVSGLYNDSGVFIASCADSFAVYDSETGALLFEDTFEGTEYVNAWMENQGLLRVNVGNETLLYRLPDGECLMRFGEGIEINGMYLLSSKDIPERLVKSEGDWPQQESWLIDLEGNDVGPHFQTLSPAAWQDGMGRYIFGTFKVVVTGSDGTPTIDWNSMRYGVCDESGNILLEAHYSNVEALAMDRYWVRLGNRCGMVDSQGKWYFYIDDYESLVD